MLPLQDIAISNKVLVVDDEALLLEAYRRVLEQVFDVTLAGSGPEALEILEAQGPFAVVLSDNRMPRMDGVAFLSRVNEAYPHTVRMMITGYAELEAAMKAVNTAQVFRFLIKPVSTQDLRAAIQDGLNHHRLLVAEAANLIERERSFRRSLLAMPLPLMLHAEDGEVLLVNQAWSELSGYSWEEIPDLKTWLRKAHPEELSPEPACAGLYQAGQEPARGVHKLLTRWGETRVWDFSSATLGSLPDQRGITITVAADITERHRMEESLKLAGKVFANTTNGIVVTDGQGLILQVNPALTAITGYEADEMIGQTPRLFKSGQHGEQFYRSMWQALLSQGAWRGEIWNRRKDGSLYPAWLTITAVDDGQGGVANYVAIQSDLSDLRQTQERLAYLSSYDPLTGLPNRDAFLKELEDRLVRCVPGEAGLTILYMDLDRFKMVNESLGHPVGDRVLREVAKRLGECLGDQALAARWAGDHFVALVEHGQGEGPAARIARSVLEAMRRPFPIDEHTIYLSASLGLAGFPGHGAEAPSLIQNADTATHVAKEQGRNRYAFFDPSMNELVRQRLFLGADLRAALKEDQFFMAYQPRVDLATGRVVGIEALIRWRHPEHGLVMPTAFLPVAEESGIIVDIGRWVLTNVCAQVMSWREQGLTPPRVAVNLSGRQFWESGLESMITRCLETHGLSAGGLELEVTESVVMNSVEQASAVLAKLAAAGITISLDDFGTGYSSLYYLKKLPISLLKIDKTFVDDIPADPDSTSLVRAITDMAHSLGMGVVVEGVEHRRQLEAVTKLGCEQVQGYYFAEPLAPGEVAGLMAGDEPAFAHLITP